MSLLTFIKKCACLPGRWKNYLHAFKLLRKAERDFEDDYRAYFRSGESKEPTVGKPILIRGTSRSLGVLLIHGFMAAPAELSELAEYLGRQGYWVYVTRVKGHGTSPEDLAGRSIEEWRASVDLGFNALSAICSQVVVGGFSFGGGVALDCAVRHDECIAGVFAVCPPMQLHDLSSRFAPAVETWNRIMDFLKLEAAKKEFVEIVPERPEINYKRLPVTSLVALERFMRELEVRLPSIASPALIIQSSGDPVVDPAGSRRLFEQLGSSSKEYRLVDRNRHGILTGPGAEVVYRVIGEFIEKARTGSENTEIF